MFDFKKLKLRIKEIFDTQDAFAQAMDTNTTSLNQRLNNVVDWKAPEIVKACELLQIPLKDCYLYFFVLKV